MGANSGRKVSRSKVGETYKGFSVIRETVKNYHWYGGRYHTDWVDSVERYYNFCKEGDEKRPSKMFSCSFTKIAEVKEAIDKMLDGSGFYYTEEEYRKYVSKPNHDNDYGFSYKSIMKLMRDYRNAEPRIKRLYEDRLTDVNFHSYCSLLRDEKYSEFEALAAKELTINEKYYVVLMAHRKGLKDPTAAADIIKEALTEYFSKHKELGDIDVSASNVPF